MAICGDLRIYATFSPCSLLSFRPIVSRNKQVAFDGFLSKKSNVLATAPDWSSFGSSHYHQNLVPTMWGHFERYGYTTRWNPSNFQCFGISGDNIFPERINQDIEGLLLNVIRMNFFERLGLAWKILFPPAASRRSSNARIAKQRLKMILFSDRCEVSDEAKRKIVKNIVGALSDFVEIDSHDNVQLNVLADAELGTVYSVTVPVRRVKAEYQDFNEDFRGITNIRYTDTGEESGTVDVKFDFFIPSEQSP